MTNTWDGWSDSQLISKYSTDRDLAAYEELVRRGRRRGLGGPEVVSPEFRAAVQRDEQARPFLAPVLLLAGVLLLSAFGCGKSRTWRTDEPQRCSNGHCHAPEIEPPPAAEAVELQPVR